MPVPANLPAADEHVLAEGHLPREVHAEDVADVEIGSAAFGLEIERILRALIAAIARVVQAGSGVDGFAEGVIGAEEQAVFEALAQGDRAGLVAGVAAEGVVLDVAITGVGARGRGGGTEFLIDVVLAAEVGALGCGVAGLDADAAAEIALDGEVPACKIRRRRIDFDIR